jgi:hypothetical protein
LCEAGGWSDRQIQAGAAEEYSLAFGRTPFHSDRDYGFIVERFDAGRVLCRRFENRLHDGLGGIVRAIGNDLFQPGPAEKLPGTIGRVQNPVAEKNE